MPPRKPNQHKTADIHITASAEVEAYLDELARMGIHGKTAAEVAKVLIGIEIERLIRERILKLRRPAKTP
jgi:hypothetical protein